MLSSFKISVRLISLLLWFTSISFAQKAKEPINPISTSSINTACKPGCFYFESNLNQLIGTDNLNFTAMVNNEQCLPAPPNAQLGCLLQIHNPRWVIIKIEQGTNLNFSITNSANTDIDAAIWGPVASQDLSNACASLSQFPASCDYGTGNPVLSINGAIVNDYYILLITNFDNTPTEIHLDQPSGGKVKYAYYCPENIQLNSSLSGNQTQNAFATVKLANVVNQSAKLKAFSGNNIELLPGFETKNEVVFEAEIHGCTNNTENYLPPNEQILCENFANHGANTPHIYTQIESNEFVATVFAKNAPYGYVYDSLHLFTKIGKDLDSDRYLWMMKTPYIWGAQLEIQSRPGCPFYADTRIVSMKSTGSKEDKVLPTVSPLSTFDNIDSPFWVSTDVRENINENSEIYTLYLKPGLAANLSVRVNEGPRLYGAVEFNGLEEYNERLIHVTKFPSFTAPKDFYLDFSRDHGVTFDRYLVTRNSGGGHFSGTTTFTRLADSTVIVSVYQGDIKVKMKLGTYESTSLFGNTFNLGKLPEGSYEFPLTSEKGEEVLDPHVFVRVRYD